MTVWSQIRWGSAVTVAACVLALSACSQPLAVRTALTQTQAPSATAVPIDKTSPTVTTTPDQAPMPTPAPTISAPFADQWEIQSPDGMWVAQGQNTPDDAGMIHIVLTLERTAGSPTWKIIDKTVQTGLGLRLPGIVQWARDGQSVYFGDYSQPDGCSLTAPHRHDLYRVDLTTGQTTTVLAPDAHAWAVTMSPDETHIAYLSSGQERYIGGRIMIKDVAGAAEKQIPLDDDAYSWGLAWSPDGRKLAFTQAKGDSCAPPSSSIFVIDTTSLERTTLVRNNPQLFQTVQWLDMNRVLLEDKQHQQWLLDIGSNTTQPYRHEYSLSATHYHRDSLL